MSQLKKQLSTCDILTRCVLTVLTLRFNGELFFAECEGLFNLHKDIFVELIFRERLSLKTRHTGIINTKSLISPLQEDLYHTGALF